MIFFPRSCHAWNFFFCLGAAIYIFSKSSNLPPPPLLKSNGSPLTDNYNAMSYSGSAVATKWIVCKKWKRNWAKKLQLLIKTILETSEYVIVCWSKLCKLNWISAWSLAFPVLFFTNCMEYVWKIFKITGLRQSFFRHYFTENVKPVVASIGWRKIPSRHGPIRSTTQISGVVTRHQYGISAIVPQTSFRRETMQWWRRKMSAVISC